MPHWTGWFWPFVRRRWLAIGGAFVVGGVVGYAASYLVTPIYRSQALLSPVKDDPTSSLSGLLSGQIGGLASLAGLVLPSSQVTAEAVATLRSRELASRLIAEPSVLPVLFYDRWDAKDSRWRNDKKGKPTIGDAILRFDKKVRTVREDPNTGLVTLSIEWRDPVVAAAWANRLVSLANEVSRKRAIDDANKSLRFLEVEGPRAQSVEVRQAVYRLVEAQLKAKTVAATREDYAFRVIDRAVPSDPDKRVWPHRGVVAVLGALLAALLGAANFVWRDSRRLAS